jgi:hypothetical protein
VTAPLSEALAEGEKLLVSGTAPAGAVVVIAGPQNETVVQAAGSDTFAGEVALAEGKNDLVVTGYIEQKEESVSLVVYYTPEVL